MYTQVKNADVDDDATRTDGQALLDQWKMGGEDGDAAVIFWNFNKALNKADVQIVAGPSFQTRVSQPALNGDRHGQDRELHVVTGLARRRDHDRGDAQFLRDQRRADAVDGPRRDGHPSANAHSAAAPPRRSIRRHRSDRHTPTRSRARPSTTTPESSAREPRRASPRRSPTSRTGPAPRPSSTPRSSRRATASPPLRPTRRRSSTSGGSDARASTTASRSSSTWTSPSATGR